MLTTEWFSQFTEAVPARGVLIARHMGQSLVVSVLAGCFGGWIGANLLTASVGPLVPYLICSSVGFIVSSVNFWTTEKNRALELKKLYPHVLQHHLITSFRGMNMNNVALAFEKETEDDSLTIPQVSWCIMAAQAAQSSIIEIESKLAESIIERTVLENGDQNRD